jgi:hypothetical protein
MEPLRRVASSWRISKVWLVEPSSMTLISCGTPRRSQLEVEMLDGGRNATFFVVSRD